ncbi:MAG: triacylglycerol lipase [Ruminococcus sp.]|uniref:esterase/lipase family protein n=1 Tax=Ruminococcus sp. TaxID=41978 RepID=UPI0025EB83FD|nr:triacylglycerol lipase [Ruminococcus sp.]MCR4794113.1 triacylglycerol lipase [Ruminococcus sp.]
MGILSLLIKMVLAFCAVNIYALSMVYLNGAMAVLAIIIGIFFVFALCAFPCRSKEGGRLGRMHRGSCLMKIFLADATAEIIGAVYFAVSGKWGITVTVNCIIAVILLALMFITAAVRIYTSSVQIGIKWRVLGVIFAFIPVINAAVLFKILRLTDNEYRTECDKLALDRSREQERVCATKYPILMVHGVFFRDVKALNYWGRIPQELEKNGAKIYYGCQQSADSVAGCAAELKAKIDEIVEREKCGKVNIIAHSKGGLDSRYAISMLGAGDRVASLTTVNTPHRGCQFADYLLNKVPESFKNGLADKYNAALKKLGDTKPDFMAAVTDLTASACEEMNKLCEDVQGVYYQSVGSRSVSAMGGRFPLNLSYHFVKYFDGPNDGLVSVESMKWGERFIFAEPKGKRGITHGDIIDLNRENIKDFDVREFYVKLVSQLKEKGI